MITLLFSLIGGLISRFHGGGFKGGVNKTFKNFLWAVPIGTITGLAFLFNNWDWASSLTVFGVVTLLSLLKSTGHGRGLGADEPLRDDMKPEKVEYLILWLEHKIPVFWYKFLIMALTGLVAVLGASIAMGFLNPLAGVLVAIGGLSKGLAYWAGIYIFSFTQNYKDFDEKTEIGEFLTGFFAYLCLILAYTIAVGG